MAQLFQQSEAEDSAEEAGEVAAQAGDPAVALAAASVAMSWYEFFGRKNKARGLFVGLWPPTILAFASYFKQVDMEDRFSQL